MVNSWCIYGSVTKRDITLHLAYKTKLSHTIEIAYKISFCLYVRLLRYNVFRNHVYYVL